MSISHTQALSAWLKKADHPIDASVSEHIETCSECAAELRRLEQTRLLVSSLGRRPLPSDLALKIRVSITSEQTRRRFFNLKSITFFEQNWILDLAAVSSIGSLVLLVVANPSWATHSISGAVAYGFSILCLFLFIFWFIVQKSDKVLYPREAEILDLRIEENRLSSELIRHLRRLADMVIRRRVATISDTPDIDTQKRIEAILDRINERGSALPRLLDPEEFL